MGSGISAAVYKQGDRPPKSGQAVYQAKAAGRTTMNEPQMRRSRPRDHGPASGELETNTVLEVLTHQVIPRLVLSESPSVFGRSPTEIRQSCELAGQEASFGARFPELQSSAKALAEMAMNNNAGGCWQLIHDLRRKEDLSPEDVMLGLIQPAARCMGEGWVADSCDFAGVTIGLWRLQQILNDLSLEVQKSFTTKMPTKLAANSKTPTLALATMPGSQHRLGLQMVNSFFSRAGWNCQMLESKSELELIGEVKRSGPDLLGLSVASEKDVLQAAGLILRLRDAKTKITSSPLVMLGGPALTAFPELAQRTDADLLVGDADLAVDLAFELLQSHASRSKSSRMKPFK
jgi:methanogenic corrinoid protein MtbC1